jgi:hypothetical protein
MSYPVLVPSNPYLHAVPVQIPFLQLFERRDLIPSNEFLGISDFEIPRSSCCGGLTIP